VDLLSSDDACRGVVSRTADGTIRYCLAPYTVLACGGVGGLFQYSTNFRHITGDAIAVALEHDVQTENVHYVQIHPTTLYEPEAQRCVLISESVRGEGALLYSVHGVRFVDELKPRDIVTNAILEQMKKDGSPYVLLSMQHLGEERIRSHFPNILKACLDRGYDALQDNIPVVPAQHYLMGGIKVDLHSRTSMPGLYAVGETSCNGVHGANRLASNSLLESLVFSKRAAWDMIEHRNAAVQAGDCPLPDPQRYADIARLTEHYKDIVWKEMRRDAL